MSSVVSIMFHVDIDLGYGGIHGLVVNHFVNIT